ncbi:MAG: preprotein translocase subunit YajC [Alphaproteobacteria bacterium]|nr:preprotein translocase subunit YajC [Alphaproteobacteria bacterium]
MFISPAFAQAEATVAQTGGTTGMILQLVLIFAVFYIFLIRPQQKRIKQHEAMVSAVKKGDTVVTGGGIYAKVVDASDPIDLMVEIADGVQVKVNRGTIRDVILPEKEAPKAKKSKPANTNKKSK